MDTTFGLSLFFLLINIPQYLNSPIPRMESWMEMDQGDGFVDRDLTSSLTGAESFGSAHKNYQNALIRKKQTGTEDELRNEGMMEDSVRVPAQMQRRAALTPNLLQNQYASYGYNSYLTNNNPNQFGYPQSVNGMNAYQEQRYRMQTSNPNEGGGSIKFDNSFPSSGLINPPLISKDVRCLRMNNDNLQENQNNADMGPRFDRCSLNGYGRFDSEGGMADIVNRLENSDETKYSTGDEDTMSQARGELNEDDERGIQFEDDVNQDENLVHYGKEGEDDLGEDESDYYGEIENPAMIKGVADTDYRQINPHGVIYKREQMKAQSSSDGGEETSQSLSNRESKAKSLKVSRSFLKAEAPKEARDITKDVIRGNIQNSNMMWSGNSNSQSNELGNLMGDSQKIELGLTQENSPEKSEYNCGNMEWKADEYAKMSPEEKRNKREDEDEQKNMKTGTDEGGGEYEDEEGKGHNDEEEYYEETEVSGGRRIRAEPAFSNNHINHHLEKRETGKDEEAKGSKKEEDSVDVSSDEYELNLENAPVEYGDKCKKSSWREGKNQKKVISRRGMKIWDEWGKWSPCSVTCGVGRKTRWRHCIGGGCASGEKEALIKKCTFPAC